MRAICVLLNVPNHPQPSEKGQGASKCTFQVVHCVVSAVKAIWADSKLRKRLEALPTRINLCMATSYLLADVLGHDFSSQEESNIDGKRLCFNATKFSGEDVFAESFVQGPEACCDGEVGSQGSQRAGFAPRSADATRWRLLLSLRWARRCAQTGIGSERESARAAARRDR